ncbi:MAG: bifunctional UDP-N-acetylglucosamine diphosphorylase/glucosamine-1-phosphate N-acetyltransferase GlmU [Acidobacteriota bacterium]
MNRTIVVLSAGKGTRMKSPRAKVLHPIMGRPMLAHLFDSLGALGASKVFAVVGHQKEKVADIAEGCGAECVVQEPQLGTGHALMCCREALQALGETEVLLVSGDVPLLPVDEVESFWKRFHKGGAAMGMVTVELESPAGYGRIIRDGEGRLARVVEEKDAGPEQKRIREVNSGIYFFRPAAVLPLLDSLGTDNAQGEYYLPDLFAALYDQGAPAATFPASDPGKWLGINTQADLASANETLRAEIVSRLMAGGVTILGPGTVWVEPTVSIDPGCVLHPFTRICGETRLGAGTEIRSFSTLRDSVVGPGTLIKENCVLEGTRTGASCIIGPFCHTREGTVLEERVHLGNFVETKKARLGPGVKANHLTYLGDAEVGEGSNIGAGTITCNYDGVRKHPTVLGRNVFVGSDTQFVAPVKVGDGAYIGAGTTVTKEVPPESLAISRAPQKNLEGWAARKKRKK